MDQFTPEEYALALKRCETEAIHQIGLVQPHGTLIVLARNPQLTVLQVSENIGVFFGKEPTDILGKPLADLIGTDQSARLASLLSGEHDDHGISTIISVLIGPEPEELQASVHSSQDSLLLELEPLRHPYQTRDVQQLLGQVRKGVWALDAADDIAAYFEIVAGLVRELSRFDRVMVYRFDPAWEGEVIAESRAPGVTSYLGNRFPAGDIPPQARQLYTRNLIRVVADVEAKPARIVPAANPLTGTSPDLTFSTLRAFSPIHVEYLRNMGVGASLSISILQEGKLWGLIACHNGSAAYIPQPIKEMLEFVGKMVSMKLAALEAGVRIAEGTLLGETMTTLLKDIYAGDDSAHIIQHHKDRILRLVKATGALLVIDGNRLSLGLVPDEERIDSLLAWLSSCPPAETLTTNYLASHHPEAAAYADIAAGILATPVTSTMQNAVIWFRPEKLRSINWAGRPEKQIEQGSSGELRISPRKSFAVWTEIWRQRSIDWTPGEISVGAVLAESLIEAIAQKSRKQREEFYRLFGDQTPEMISQLDHLGRFTYASSSSRIVLGQTPEQLLGRNLGELIDNADRADFERFLAGAEQQASSAVFRAHRADGESIWLDASIKRIDQASGAGKLMLIARDVTERQKFYLAVEEFQQLNLSLLESSGEGILAVDLEGTLTFANPAACDILGWSASELIGQHAHSAIRHSRMDAHPSPIENCIANEAMESGQPRYRRDDCYYHRDGHPLKVTAVAMPIVNNGLTTGAIIVFIQVIDGEAPNPLISHETDGAIMALDREGRITAFSDALTRLTGYSSDEAIGQMPSLLRSNVHTRSFFRDMWQRVQQDKHWRGLIWNRCKDGSIRPFWLSMSAVCEPRGAIDQYVAVYAETTAKSSPEAQLQFLASHDNLTGLPNRTLLSSRLRQAIARAARQGTRIAIAFIDLDHFKEINDQLGHASGDQFLIELARRLTENSREEDTIARWGGDEFLLLMEDIHAPDTATLLSERILAKLRAPIELSTRTIEPSASIGIALFPDDAQSATSLIEAADKAMYNAKQDGRNRIVSFRSLLTGHLH